MANFTKSHRHSLHVLAITEGLGGLCLQTGLGTATASSGECSNPQEARTVCVVALAASLNLSEPESQSSLLEIKYLTKLQRGFVSNKLKLNWKENTYHMFCLS
jgi:hypothetical protein